jgi:2-keto-4-pentenoate hydratase
LVSQATQEAARLFAAARASGAPLDRLPEASRPRSAAEAYEIQLETAALMNESVAGWKVALSEEYELLIGALLRSRVFEDGSTISARDMAMVGVEAEIAFRFDQPLEPRERAYERVEIEELVTAFPAIEILDSRLRDYHGASVIDRAADFMSNSAFVVGTPREDWQSFDLARLEARLLIDGVELVRTVGGHAAGDALIPAIALANTLRHTTGIPAGHMVTTGTYTGLKFIERNRAVHTQFVGFGDVSCRFVL